MNNLWQFIPEFHQNSINYLSRSPLRISAGISLGILPMTIQGTPPRINQEYIQRFFIEFRFRFIQKLFQDFLQELHQKFLKEFIWGFIRKGLQRFFKGVSNSFFSRDIGRYIPRGLLGILPVIIQGKYSEICPVVLQEIFRDPPIIPPKILLRILPEIPL